ncbi:MAG: aldo/keto reductase family protein [Planctomycetota bacterium]
MIPTFIYGTAWKEERTKGLVLEALKAGFRAIDTANQRKHYFEAGVGEALKEAYATGLVKREDLFLQTKFTHLPGQDHRLPYDSKADIGTQVLQSFQSSLEHLGTDRLDSYVLHGPTRRVGLGPDDWGAWKAMEEIHDLGRVGALGVSNVTAEQLKLLHKEARIKPLFAQIRTYADTGWEADTRDVCRRFGIQFQGFSLLTANGEVARMPAFQEIVRRTGFTPAQVIFAFCRQAGMIPMTGTTNAQHMGEDLASLSMELSSGDVATIESLSA